MFLYKPSNWLHSPYQVKVELNCAESISSIDFFFLFDRLLNRKHKRLQSHVLVLALNAPIANDWSSLWNIVKTFCHWYIIVISCKIAVKFCSILHFDNTFQVVMLDFRQIGQCPMNHPGFNRFWFNLDMARLYINK